jgi:hypothetical protein
MTDTYLEKGKKIYPIPGCFGESFRNNNLAFHFLYTMQGLLGRHNGIESREKKGSERDLQLSWN